MEKPNVEHYQQCDIEPIDFIKALGDLEAFCRGNIIKYISRYKHKDGIIDLEKAKVYLEWLIENVENQELPVVDMSTSESGDITGEVESEICSICSNCANSYPDSCCEKNGNCSIYSYKEGCPTYVPKSNVTV